MAPFNGVLYALGWVGERKALLLKGESLTFVAGPVRDVTPRRSVREGEQIAIADPYGRRPHLHMELWPSPLGPAARERAKRVLNPVSVYRYTAPTRHGRGGGEGWAVLALALLVLVGD